MIKKIIYTVLFLAALISLSFAEISQVWRTGQTTSYSAGDDGALRKGAAWPTPRFTVNSSGTLTDKLTGLVWAQNAKTPTVGACTGGVLSWEQALSYVACLNSSNYLGSNDWRMPNRKELMSLVDYSRTYPALVSEASDSLYFGGVAPAYWSGSPMSGWGTVKAVAWILTTGNGSMSAYTMQGIAYTWPVRGTSTVSPNPAISLLPAEHSFGNVAVGGTSAPQQFLLSNAGKLDLVVSAITMTGSSASLFNVATGGSTPCESLSPTILPGSSCTIVATFAPSTGGYASADLEVSSNDQMMPSLRAPLSGTGAYALSVAKTGTGSGSVSSVPAGISCGSDCTELYAAGTSVTLTASPSSGSVFAGWSGGGCSGTGTCTVAMNAVTNVTAAFDSAPQTYTLTVSKTGTGTGAVSSAPAGISCGADCSEAYAANTSVTLTAAPDPASVFTGWLVSGSGWSSSGSSVCPGTGPCTVVMTSNRTVLAQFERRGRLTLTAPNGGESLTRGSTYFISWNADGISGTSVRIELLKGGAVKKVIARKASIGSGGYRWKVPRTVASDYRIRITSTSNSSDTDTSDGYFSITN